eukprot:Em0009g1136a
MASSTNGALVICIVALTVVTNALPLLGRLEVVPSSRVKNGQQVRLSWKPRPLEEDWVGLYCPPDRDGPLFLQRWPVPDSATYENGYWTTKITFEGGARAPLQGHLALTGNPTEMRVQWTSGSNDAPVVLYGLDPDSLEGGAVGSTRTYNYTDMCGPPANTSEAFVDPGYLHDALLTGLAPSTKYYYQYGDGSLFSAVTSFITSPEPYTFSMQPFTFITYGDMGLSPAPGASKVAAMVLQEVENGVSFVMHQGDLSYALGHAYIWDAWMSLIEPYSSRAPYMVSIGNHEQDHTMGGANDPSHASGNGFHPWWGNYGDDSGGECGVPFYNRFHMPEQHGYQPWWYSFDYGMAHFAVISTEHNFTRGSIQYQWLESDLEMVDKASTPWLILVGHRPMYSSEEYFGDYVVTLNMQQALEDLFHQYRVDLALWGHYHSYERTCPVYRQVCDPSGTVHVVIGSAGNTLDDVPTFYAPWSEHFDPSFGYGRVTVENSSALLWEYVRSKDASIPDRVWLTH